jgi:hypothetical protein
MSDKTSKNEDIEAEHSEATETESEYESTDNDTEDEHATGEASEKKKKKKKVGVQSIPHRSPGRERRLHIWFAQCRKRRRSPEVPLGTQQRVAVRVHHQQPEQGRKGLKRPRSS